MQGRGKEFGKWRVVREFVQSRHSTGYQEEVYCLLRTQADSTRISPATDAAVARPEKDGAEPKISSSVPGELIYVP